MFHHFHDDRTHARGQGSISKDDFYKLINFIGRKNILDADIFFKKFKTNKLKNNEVCLSFDDAIKSQVDIALPVLEDLKIKSFFFVYTSIFDGKPDNLEIFRFFRMNYFNSVEKFYKEFYSRLDIKLDNFFDSKKKIIKNNKLKFPIYSIDDIKFRLVRDQYLKKEMYEKTMFDMFAEKNFIPEKIYSRLFFDKNDLIKINSLNHLIGLHSHNHTTLMENLSYEQQKTQYSNCLSIISSIIKRPKCEIKFMSHPSGSYNNHTLKILKDLGIELGFKQIMTIESERGMKKINNSFLEIARQDHSEIMKRIN